MNQQKYSTHCGHRPGNMYDALVCPACRKAEADELTAARKVVAAAKTYHDFIIGRENCLECEWYESIGFKPCRILESLAEYNEVVK